MFKFIYTIVNEQAFIWSAKSFHYVKWKYSKNILYIIYNIININTIMMQ